MTTKWKIEKLKIKVNNLKKLEVNNKLLKFLLNLLK